MVKRKLNMVCISDVHLGHRNTDTTSIISNLNKYLLGMDKFNEIDVLWIAGDFFDRLIYTSEVVLCDIILFIAKLLKRCGRDDILVRVLEGTPSHDRAQNKLFMAINESSNAKVDIKYIDTLSIEFVDSLGISVLYVPDEISPTTDETKSKVQTLLSDNALHKVDYAIMHGMFAHQVPNGIPLPTHDSEYYLSIVKKYIFIGHVHLMSTHDRILSQGSFDRLSHGEEGDKGFWHVIANNDNEENDTLTFVINHGATRYDTVDTNNRSTDEIDMDLQVLVRVGNNVRLLMHRTDANESLYIRYSKQFPHINWSKKLIKVVNDSEENVLKPVVYDAIAITQATLPDLVISKLLTMGASSDDINLSLAILEELN